MGVLSGIPIRVLVSPQLFGGSSIIWLSVQSALRPHIFIHFRVYSTFFLPLVWPRFSRPHKCGMMRGKWYCSSRNGRLDPAEVSLPCHGVRMGVVESRLNVANRSPATVSEK